MARCQMLEKRKQLLNEEIKSFEKDFTHIFQKLNELRYKSKQYLEGILKIDGPEEFNKKFAKSRSLTTSLGDHLSSLKAILSDSFIKELCFDSPQSSLITNEGLDWPDKSQELRNNFTVQTNSSCSNREPPKHGAQAAAVKFRNVDSFLPRLSTFSEHPFVSGVVEGIIPLVISPWMFYFQPLALLPLLEVVQDCLNAFMTHKMKTKNEEVPSNDFQVSDLVAARFTVDQKWYRARIITITESGEDAEFEVLFLDYGNSEVLPSSSLRALPKELAILPGLAICCSLSNVSPMQGACTWPDTSARTFGGLVSGRRCYEPITIKPLSQVEDALTFVNLFQKGTSGCDVVEELVRMECLEVAQDNRNALIWFEYLCRTEDEKRRFRGDSFMKRSTVFNSPKILCVQSEIIQDFRKNHTYPIVDRKVNKPDPSVETSGNSSSPDSLKDACLKESNCNEEGSVLPGEAFEREYNDDDPDKKCDESESGSSTGDSSTEPVRRHPSFNYRSISVTDEEMKVYAMHVESPSRFWLVFGEETKEMLAKMTEELQEWLSKEGEEARDLTAGSACLGHFERSDGGGFELHRCKVIRVVSILKTEEICEVEVSLVDEGRTKVLRPDEGLFEIPSRFAEVPPAAVVCRLEGIEPADAIWSKESLDYFRAEVATNRDFRAYFGSKYCLGDLIDPRNGEPIEMDLRIMKDDDTDESVVALMVKRGFAKLLAEIDGGTKCEEEAPYRPTTPDRMEIILKEDICSEYLSVRNSYAVATENPGVALANYEAKDERKICRFFNTSKGCWWGKNCHYAHVQSSGRGVVSDTALVCGVPSTDLEPVLPDRGSWATVQISAFVNPRNYYVVILSGGSGTESHLSKLMTSLNKHYNTKVIPDHDLTRFARGEVVVVRSVKFDLWHRAMIVDCIDEEEYEVYYVDYGNTESLSASRIRSMELKFMHLPYQAVKSLSPIVPVASQEWPQGSIYRFKTLVEGAKLTAQVLDVLPCGSLVLDLYNDKFGMESITNMMVKDGLAVRSIF